VSLDALTRTIDITVVEVKLRSTLSSGDRAHLYIEMREQSNNTIQTLHRLFDPDFLPRPRADFFASLQRIIFTAEFLYRTCAALWVALSR
jgi:hypothetical protein